MKQLWKYYNDRMRMPLPRGHLKMGRTASTTTLDATCMIHSWDLERSACYREGLPKINLGISPLNMIYRVEFYLPGCSWKKIPNCIDTFCNAWGHWFMKLALGFNGLTYPLKIVGLQRVRPWQYSPLHCPTNYRAHGLKPRHRQYYWYDSCRVVIERILHDRLVGSFCFSSSSGGPAWSPRRTTIWSTFSSLC